MGGGVTDETPPFLNLVFQKSDLDYDTDNPHRPTPSVTTTTAQAPECNTQSLPSHDEGPDIGNLHAMPPNPRLGAGIEAEITTTPPFLRVITAVANFRDSNALHMPAMVDKHHLKS